MSHPTIEQQVTFLYTRDIAESAAFYEQILELPLVLDQGTCRIYAVSSSGYLGICYSDQAPQQPQGIIFTLATHEVDQWYQLLSAKGVVFEKPPAHNPKFNIYHCFLRDPNGYLLEIQEFLDPAWPGNAIFTGNSEFPGK